MSHLLALDRRLFLVLHGRSPSTRGVARWLSRSGDGWMYALVALVLYVAGWTEGDTHLWTLAVAFAIELPLCMGLKQVLRRERPAVVFPHLVGGFRAADRFSFPSGHACAAWLHATVLGAAEPRALLLLVPWAIGVAWSRIRLGVHFPADVAVGGALGVVCALVALQLS